MLFSGSPSEAMFCIKQVETVDSVDDLKSLRSINSGLCSFPEFYSHFKKKASLEEQKAQKENRFLRGRQISYMIYDYFWVVGAHDTVLDYADLFTITVLRNDDVQEFDTRWDEILLSMTKIPPDDVLESFYKSRFVSLINSKPY